MDRRANRDRCCVAQRLGGGVVVEHSMVTRYTIGVPAGPSGWTITDQVHAQLRLAHKLREDLVTVQLLHEQALEDMWSSYPRVAYVEWLLAEADHLAAQLNTQPAEVRRLRQCRRDEIAAVSEDSKARRTELVGRLAARHKQLYADYCRSGDLYWGTFNFILKAHTEAVKRISDQRKRGRPAALRRHRFDGTGTLAVTLQRQAGKPARTPAVIADPDGRYRNVLFIPWVDPDVWERMTRAQRVHAGRGIVRMRCGSRDGRPEWVDIQVQAHRMAPAHADISGATLTITRTADRYRAQIAVTAELPRPQPVTGGPTVAMHMSWRDTAADLQVATWRSSRPLDIPAAWHTVMAPDSSRNTGRIVLPEYLTERLDRADQLRSKHNRDLNRLRTRLVAWLDERGPVPHPTRDGQITAGEVARWRSPSQFASLARAWSERCPTGAEKLLAALFHWRRRWQDQENLRARTLRRRDDMWRNIAAILADQCGQVVLDGTRILSTARPPSDRPDHVEATIAQRRALAAPGRLRSAIMNACNRDGVAVRVVSADGLSRIHARCGHENPGDDRYVSRPVRCDGCGSDYDPDQSATALMLERAKG